MQPITLLALFFTALVNAASNHGPHAQRFHHRRALNASDPAITTLTVNVTTIRTVFGCPSTKTDCPLATHPISVVTDIVAVYTTICPQSVAQSVAASISSSVATSGVMASNLLPVVTSPVSTATNVAQSPMPSSGQSKTTQTTLTYVLGTGSTRTTVTTTLKLYKTETDYVTKYTTKPSPSATISVVNSLPGQQAAVTVPNPLSGSSMKPTTTITSTSTTRKTVTVLAVAPGASSSGKPSNSTSTVTKTVTIHGVSPGASLSGNSMYNSPVNSNLAMNTAVTSNSKAAVTATAVVSNAALVATQAIETSAKAAPTANLNTGIAFTPSAGGCPPPVTVNVAAPTVTLAASTVTLAASTITVAMSTLTVALSTLTVTYTEMGAAKTLTNLVATAAAISTGSPKINSAPVSSTPMTVVGGSKSSISASSPMSSHVAPYMNGTITTNIKPSCGSSSFLTQANAASSGKSSGTGLYYPVETGHVQSKPDVSATGMAAPSGYYY